MHYACISKSEYLFNSTYTHTHTHTHTHTVTFLEVLPKDKKAKEEKTSVLGQASIDLLPFIRSQSNASTHTITATLHPSSPDGAHPAVISEPPPGVDVGLVY